MELREWLIILGLVLVAIIVVDGVRRLQRQRKVPRLDEVPSGASKADEDNGEALDPEEAARRAEINWELPNGGARVVRPAAQTPVEPKPKLQRQEHPGPSKVFARMSRSGEPDERMAHRESPRESPPAQAGRYADEPAPAAEAAREESASPTPRREPSMNVDATERATDTAQPRRSVEPPAVRDDDEVPATDTDAGRARGKSAMAAALRSGGQRVSQSMQRMTSAWQRHEAAPALHDEDHEPSLDGNGGRSEESRGDARREESCGLVFPRFADQRLEPVGSTVTQGGDDDAYEAERQDIVSHMPREEAPREDVVTVHPVVEKAQRHHVSAQRARETLAHSDEIVVISVMSRNEEGFAGTDLLNLMLACGLRYSEMGIFLRYETEDNESELQFAMVDVVKPGTFDLDTMDDFSTPGVTFLMPLPGARDSAAAFEAMVETAMVIVRNLGGELKDENRSVMTAQTVEFARQRVQEFERRYRLHRSHAN
ncbi:MULTISPECIES: cell division protein ZipA [Halomonadaceae]|uniref:Cell division protein ZipA n=1 Tax=Modicisalibacter zincidurans TaxID=1178777 RepID=A0ABP9RDU6_9GAMM|nr:MULTISPECIES: cell division protein ZipA [Halomonas]MCD6009016.1 cell division protein ZipA [Halomonas sp. IOP_31]